MLAMIDNFLFEIGEASYQRVKESFDFGWSKNERLYNNPIYMKKNGTSHPIDIEGTLILKKVYALDRLVSIAEQKLPVVFVVLAHARVFRVVILNITIDRDILLDNGAEVRKIFSIRMEEFYGN